MNSKKIFIYKNDTDASNQAYDHLCDILYQKEYTITDSTDDAELIACIGGDGTFLHFAQECSFPSSEIIGINTGHLGFFQEILPHGIAHFFELYETKEYSIQRIAPIEATIRQGEIEKSHLAVNEILLRGPHTHITHLSVSVDDTIVQEYSGDGIMFSTPVGSTAYNYALGGSIIDPDLNAYQMTPIAPLTTNAYRCFATSILYPAKSEVTVTPIRRSIGDELTVVADGLQTDYDSIDSVTFRQSKKELQLIRFSDYDYWTKLKSKLL